jgi:hypothetical protein
VHRTKASRNSSPAFCEPNDQFSGGAVQNTTPRKVVSRWQEHTLLRPVPARKALGFRLGLFSPLIRNSSAGEVRDSSRAVPKLTKSRLLPMLGATNTGPLSDVVQRKRVRGYQSTPEIRRLRIKIWSSSKTTTKKSFALSHTHAKKRGRGSSISLYSCLKQRYISIGHGKKRA